MNVLSPVLPALKFLLRSAQLSSLPAAENIDLLVTDKLAVLYYYSLFYFF